MKIFTVVGYYESTGKICCDAVEAGDCDEAFLRICTKRKAIPDYNLVVAIEGDHIQLCSLAFPGESPVDLQTFSELDP